MGSANDLRRAEELVAEGRRIVQQQKGLIVRLRAAGVDTLEAERTLRLFEANLGALRNTETLSKVERSYFPRTAVRVLHDETGVVYPRQSTAAYPQEASSSPFFNASVKAFPIFR